MADAEAGKKTSDLPVRFASAVVMILIAGAALALGGTVLNLLIFAVALVAFGELVNIARRAFAAPVACVSVLVIGLAYIGLATFALLEGGRDLIVVIVGAVVFVDVFAYFFGRGIGGPKIAPKISPSKTWAGLLGGAVGAFVFLWLYGALGPQICRAYYDLTDPLVKNGTFFGFDDRCHWGGMPSPAELPWLALIAICIAVIAQSGDFLESWLKRRAGLKDSSNLIPGHGGVLDRVDGMLAVSFVAGVLLFYNTILTA